MKITKLLSIYIGIAISATAVYGQSDLVSFTGLGRVYITNDKITGNAVANDTTSKKRATNGYTLFDLGINVSPNEYVKASVILRAKNNFGGFYGDGSSLNIRQFRVEGTLGKIVKYQVGDIDLGLTPYTLFNFEEIYHDYEADVFNIRRNIVAYENFNFGNKWRLQGLDAKTTLRFAKGIDKLKLNAFGTRIKRSNYSTFEPDRLLYGGRAHIIQSKYFEVAGNLTGISDVAGTVRDTLLNINNIVYTGEVKGNYEIGKVELGLFAELGSSKFSYKNDKKKIDKGYDDYFYDGGLRVAYRPSTFIVSLEGSYRDVGAQFSSPSAQTRRINDFSQPALFDLTNNNSTYRRQALYDRLTNEQLYNQSIRVGLMNFLPEYNNITPYGSATPNRKGVTAKFSIKDQDKLVQLDAVYEGLTEVIGEGTLEKRSFTGIRGGLLFNANKLLKWKKAIALSVGGRTENTTRSGVLPVDLKSTLVDFGLSVEVLKSLDLLGGYKMFNAKGNEFLTYRDFYTGFATSYNDYSVNSSEDIIAVGARYRFNNKSFFTVNYQLTAYKNKIENQQFRNYNLDELFCNYTLVF